MAYIKTDNPHYNTLHEGIRKYLDYKLTNDETNKETFRQLLKENRTELLWKLFWEVAFDLMWDDSHQKFKSGKRTRIVDFAPDWNMYFDEQVNDNHWDTALKSIAKSLKIDEI